MVRITGNQVQAQTANPSALTEAKAQLAAAEAGLFQAEAERSTARAELERTVGR
jgi:outer membrane protein TolC